MTAMTVGSTTATVRTAKSAPNQPAGVETGLFARLLAAFMESRMRQAEREIAMHRHLLPAEFQIAGERLSRSEKDLPFAR